MRGQLVLSCAFGLVTALYTEILSASYLKDYNLIRQKYYFPNIVGVVVEQGKKKYNVI